MSKTKKEIIKEVADWAELDPINTGALVILGSLKEQCTDASICGSAVCIGNGLCEVMLRYPMFAEITKSALYTYEKLQEEKKKETQTNVL